MLSLFTPAPAEPAVTQANPVSIGGMSDRSEIFVLLDALVLLAKQVITSSVRLTGYRRKRGGFVWTGYMVHVSETCGTEDVHLLTHVYTTPATVHEAQCTGPIQQALVDKDLAPTEHFVDADYVDAALLVSSRQDHGIDVIDLTRPNVSW